jgi:hypothetical protein
VSIDVISFLARKYSSSNCPPQWQLRKIVFRVRLYASALNSLKLLQASIKEPHTSILEVIVGDKFFCQNALVLIDNVNFVDNALILSDKISHRTNQLTFHINTVNRFFADVLFKFFKLFNKIFEIGDTQLQIATLDTAVR